MASCGDNRFLFFNGIISIPLIFRRSLRHLHHFSWLYVELNPIEAFDGPLVLSWKPNLSQLGTGKTFEPKSFLVIFAYRSYFCFVFFVCLFVFYGGGLRRKWPASTKSTENKNSTKKNKKNSVRTRRKAPVPIKLMATACLALRSHFSFVLLFLFLFWIILPSFIHTLGLHLRNDDPTEEDQKEKKRKKEKEYKVNQKKNASGNCWATVEGPDRESNFTFRFFFHKRKKKEIKRQKRRPLCHFRALLFFRNSYRPPPPPPHTEPAG